MYIILTLREHFWVKPCLHTVHMYIILTLREYFWVKPCSHTVHVYIILTLREHFWVKPHLHTVHVYIILTLREHFWVKPSLHTVHVYIILTLREHFWVKPRLHTVHVYGLDPVWIRRCRFRSLLFRNLTKQHQSINWERYGWTSRTSPSPYRTVFYDSCLNVTLAVETDTLLNP